VAVRGQVPVAATGDAMRAGVIEQNTRRLEGGKACAAAQRSKKPVGAVVGEREAWSVDSGGYERRGGRARRDGKKERGRGHQPELAHNCPFRRYPAFVQAERPPHLCGGAQSNGRPAAATHSRRRRGLVRLQHHSSAPTCVRVLRGCFQPRIPATSSLCATMMLLFPLWGRFACDSLSGMPFLSVGTLLHPNMKET
jgi:hypothetical protein